MARKVGKVESVPKVWLSRKEAAAYLGVTTELLRTKIDFSPLIELYQLEDRTFVYNINDLDRYVRSKKVKKLAVNS